jgi:membrane-bound lytic murein transglycosylase B
MTNDGKISPFGAPDDALASTARYFVERGKYRRGEQLNRSGIRFH